MTLLASPANDLRHLDKIGPNRGVAVDVGANVGMFTYRLAQLYDKVYAFEINPAVARYIELLHSEKITLVKQGLSSVSGCRTLYVPRVRGRALHGWASLNCDNCVAAESFSEIPVSVTTLDSFRLATVQFIKIDVEGHELDVLAGSVNTLRTCRPVVMIEVKHTNRQAVSDFFAALSYRQSRLEEVLGCAVNEEDFVYRYGGADCSSNRVAGVFGLDKSNV
jgi:FkbM family methyltransferase